MKQFQVKTANNNTITIEARSEFHGRKMFAAKFEKSFGRLVSITPVTQKEDKQTMRVTAAGRRLR